MAAITIAQGTFKGVKVQPMDLLQKLSEMDLLKESVEDILSKEEISELFKAAKGSKKRTSVSLEDRIGQYNEHQCDARIWKEKPRSGGLGLDNVQCSSKKADGCGCLCKKHFKMQEKGGLWTGLITESRPENPVHPTAGPKQWSTDADGNEVVKERKKRSSNKKVSDEKKPKASKKKVEKEWTEEELIALLEQKKKAKFEQEEKEEEEATDNLQEGAGVYDTETEDLSEDEEDIYEIITVDSVEYQLNKEDLSVIRCDDFSPVGVWNKETETIDFDENDE